MLKMDLLVKSNSMRSKAREKRKEIENKEKNNDGLQEKLKLINVKVVLAHLIIRLMQGQ